jgi:uncharacterized protein YqfA (UPF0365 family)
MNYLLPAILIAITLAVLLAMGLFFSIFRIWVRAVAAGVPIPLLRVLAMRLRGNPAQLLIDAHILLTKAGVVSSFDETESIFMQNRNRVRTAEDLVRLVKVSKQKR